MTERRKSKEGNDMSESKSFEEKLKDVENIIGFLEEGKSSLEESLKQYENGMKILHDLETELNAAEQKLTVIRDGIEVPVEK